jgi:hypothetical protein
MTTQEFVTNNNMVIIPHPLYSQDLALCDFALFPELKMKLRRLLRQCLTLNSIEENDFHGAFEAWKHDGIDVYIPKETILKEMAVKLSKLTYYMYNTWVTSKVMATNFFFGKHVIVKKVHNIHMKGHDWLSQIR